MENTFSFTKKEIEILKSLVKKELWVIESQHSFFDRGQQTLICLQNKLKN